MPMGTVGFVTKKEAVADQLREEILSGTYAPGVSLLQHAVARRLGVSPTPVREAFQALVGEGLLEIEPHRGVVVTEQTYSDIADVYEIRALIEVAALRRALARTDQLVDALEPILEQTRQALRPRLKVHAFRRSAAHFHAAIVAASQSRVYTALADKLIVRSTYFVPLSRERVRRIQTQHEEIVRALKANHPRKALALMRQHMIANLKSGGERLTNPRTGNSPRIARKQHWGKSSASLAESIRGHSAKPRISA